MDDEKRMVDTYEVKHAIHVGDKEILFAVDNTKTDYSYMVCNCTWDNPLGIDHYFNAAASADYVEMMTEFTDRVTAQLEAVKTERDKISIPLEPFTLERCIRMITESALKTKLWSFARSACALNTVPPTSSLC